MKRKKVIEHLYQERGINKILSDYLYYYTFHKIIFNNRTYSRKKDISVYEYCKRNFLATNSMTDISIFNHCYIRALKSFKKIYKNLDKDLYDFNKETDNILISIPRKNIIG